MSKVRCFTSVGILYLCVAGVGLASEGVYDVRGYGANADGKSLCTKSVQKAIDQCAEDGGGTVCFPQGTFLTGTLFMKSGVTLRLDPGCTLLGSKDLQDYPETVQAFRSYTDNYNDKSLIYAENLDRIAIVGGGTIDGQGRFFKGPYKVRPYMIRFVRCRNVVVEDVTIKNSPMWVQHYLACDNVRITGITVRSRVNHNNDGIDIDSCRRVIVSDCNIDSGDDAIVLKSTSARACRDVVVSNCVLSSQCNALKMGTESNGGFEDIVLTGCSIYDTGLAGVALEIVDGGKMDRVVVSDMTMNKVGAPIFLRLGNRARPFKKDREVPGIGAVCNVTIANIEATGAGPTGCAISGLPQARVEGLTLSNLRLSFAGGGTKQDAARAIAENESRYPEYNMFGKLPAYGFYCRHVSGLRLNNVQLRLADADRRHAIVFDDVKDAVIDQLDAASSAASCATIRLTDVEGVLIRGCRPKKGTDVFLRLDGPDIADVFLVGSDLSDVATVVQMGPDVPQTALAQVANLVD